MHYDDDDALRGQMNTHLFCASTSSVFPRGLKAFIQLLTPSRSWTSPHRTMLRSVSLRVQRRVVSRPITRN